MSEPRDDAARPKGSAGSGGWREFASSALLVGAVAAILVTGLVLKADRLAPPAAAGGLGPSAPEALPLGSTIVPDPPPSGLPAPTEAPPESPAVVPAPPAVSAAAPAPEADRRLAALAARAASDAARLSQARGPWTAQLVVACRRETVDRMVAASGASAKLYVLPAEIRGDACFRVCWGAYGTAKDAAAAADLPKALRGKDKIAAVEIAKVLP